MNVLFLDYDGVVNIAMWDEKGKVCRFNHPSDNKVNHFQAVQWISKLCQDMDLKIVVTSSWRRHDNWKECLINGGLREGIEILGHTSTDRWGEREVVIEEYLEEHPEIEKYLIVDDEKLIGFDGHFLQCDLNVGFSEREYFKALNMLKEMEPKTE